MGLRQQIPGAKLRPGLRKCCKRKQKTYLCKMLDPVFSRAGGQLLEEMAGTGNWLEGERFRSSASEEDVRVWVEGLGL